MVLKILVGQYIVLYKNFEHFALIYFEMLVKGINFASIESICDECYNH